MTSLLELSGDAWARHRHDGTAVENGALVLAPGRGEGAFQAALPRGPDVDRLVVSPNPSGPWPEGALLRVRVRARRGEAWTPWAPLGLYGRGEKLPTSEVGPDPGALEIHTDTALLARPTRQVELRLELVRGPGGASPRLVRLYLAAWLHAERGSGAEPAHPAWGRELEVPERSQKVEDPAIAGRICSPTSLSMVLARWGRVLPTAEVARRVYDHGAAIYGNWSFNVALAAELGLSAAVARVSSFAPVEDEIAAGRPVVITHRHGPGEVQGGAVNGTDGHLIVVRGFTAEGDPIVNDPAADPRAGQSIRRVYRRQDLARSWLQNADGVCYLVRE